MTSLTRRLATIIRLSVWRQPKAATGGGVSSPSDSGECTTSRVRDISIAHAFIMRALAELETGSPDAAQ